MENSAQERFEAKIQIAGRRYSKALKDAKERMEGLLDQIQWNRVTASHLQEVAKALTETAARLREQEEANEYEVLMLQVVSEIQNNK